MSTAPKACLNHPITYRQRPVINYWRTVYCIKLVLYPYCVALVVEIEWFSISVSKSKPNQLLTNYTYRPFSSRTKIKAKTRVITYSFQPALFRLECCTPPPQKQVSNTTSTLVAPQRPFLFTEKFAVMIDRNEAWNLWVLSVWQKAKAKNIIPFLCMVDDKWHQHSFKCWSPLFSLQSEKGAGRQGIGRYRSGNESVFFFSFPLVFILSGCVTYVWRSDHTGHASVQLLCYVVICLNAFIFVLLLFNSKLSLKPSWKKKEKSIHLKKLKLKQ